MTKMAAKWPKSIPYLWLKRLKNPTLWGCTYLYSPYKGLPPGEHLPLEKVYIDFNDVPHAQHTATWLPTTNQSGIFNCVSINCFDSSRHHRRGQAQAASQPRSQGPFSTFSKQSMVPEKRLTLVIERFSNDCRKTKTITPTNHNRSKQHYEPITIPSNYLQLAQSAGKIRRTWCDWFWFYFSLVEELARVFLANH